MKVNTGARTAPYNTTKTAKLLTNKQHNLKKHTSLAFMYDLHQHAM